MKEIINDMISKIESEAFENGKKQALKENEDLLELGRKTKKEIENNKRFQIVQGGIRYINLEMFCKNTLSMFFMDSTSTKQYLSKVGILFYNDKKSKYEPVQESDLAKIFDNKIYINRKIIDEFILSYTIERLVNENVDIEKVLKDRCVIEKRLEHLNKVFECQIAPSKNKNPLFNTMKNMMVYTTLKEVIE